MFGGGDGEEEGDSNSAFNTQKKQTPTVRTRLQFLLSDRHW
jgi:hypothetical protein